jgi:uncharacterized protein
MGKPVVHFEIIGKQPEKLQSYYGALFGWNFDNSNPPASEISEPYQYGFVKSQSNGGGINGGVGGGPAYDSHVIFYISVDDVEAALGEAERLGGKRLLGPVTSPGGALVVGHFTDPQGNLVGVAGAK